MIGGVKKEVKPIYDHIVVLLKELEALYIKPAAIEKV
jgi:hypothetical protein